MQPYLAANLAVLEEMYDHLAELIRPLDEACLNWSPPIPETNSIAALVVHIAGSIDNWLGRALDEPVQRDRDAEFRARHDAEALLASIEQSRRRVRERFDRLEAVDPGTVRRVRRLQSEGETSLTVAWCVEHAVIHAGEHWGQIQLNRQLYAARGG
jgi:uncharacterized damage-inducible protein DinB